jgi:hypothetical protein
MSRCCFIVRVFSRRVCINIPESFIDICDAGASSRQFKGKFVPVLKYHAMKMYVVTEVNLYTFLTSRLGGSCDQVYASAALPLE